MNRIRPITYFNVLFTASPTPYQPDETGNCRDTAIPKGIPQRSPEKEKAAATNASAFVNSNSKYTPAHTVCRRDLHGFVGLLTATFRHVSFVPARRARLLSAPLQGFNDPLSRYAHPNVRRAGTPFSQLQTRPKRPDPCPGLSPDSLVQREQECVSDPFSKPGRAFATKADIY